MTFMNDLNFVIWCGPRAHSRACPRPLITTAVKIVSGPQPSASYEVTAVVIIVALPLVLMLKYMWIYVIWTSIYTYMSICVLYIEISLQESGNILEYMCIYLEYMWIYVLYIGIYLQEGGNILKYMLLCLEYMWIYVLYIEICLQGGGNILQYM